MTIGKRLVAGARTRAIPPILLASLILAGPVGGCAGGSGEPTSPALPPVPPPAANPDSLLAGRIVYTAAGQLHIYTVATRSDVDLRVAGINPKFSPNGSLIAYQFSGGVGVMSSDGSDRRTLSPTGGVPSFDPTGQIIAYGDRTSGIWKVNVDGTAQTQITSDGGFQPAFSPDGTRIAYNATVPGVGQQLFIVNADGTNRRQALTSLPIIDVVWRPSSKILFGLLVEPLNYDGYTTGGQAVTHSSAKKCDLPDAIHSYDPNVPTSLTRLTTKTDNDFEPSWSPDEKHIAWSNVSGGLWIMNADGSGQHQVLGAARQGSWGK